MIGTGRDVEGTLRTPVCIVGSGPAGMTVALELERFGIDCVLLESGGRAPDAAHATLNETPQVGIRTETTEFSRLRALGGSTWIWGGLVRRLDAADFERRHWVPGSGWPIGLDDLLPYYDVAHRLLELPPAEYDAERVDPAAGTDAALGRGDFENVVFYFGGGVTQFAPHFGPGLEQSARIRTLLDATLVDIETDELGRRATAVRAATLDGHRFRIEAERIVLAGGTVNNARMLLNANTVQRAGLGNNNDQVGRNFLQHPVWRAPRLLSFDRARSFRLRRDGEGKAVLMTALRPEAARAHEILRLHVLLIRPLHPPPDQDLRTRFGAWRTAVRKRWSQPRGARDVERYLGWLQTRIEPESEGPLLAVAELRPEQAPNPDSRITLSDERDAVGMRRAVMDWRLGELDQRSWTEGLRLFARSMAIEDVGRVDAAPDEVRIPAPRSLYLDGGHHQYGTTRMSGSPRTGVVDAQCRVHGIDNLYVAGASVFPTTGYANPTLTIMALAARLAEHIAKASSPTRLGDAAA